MRLDELHVNIDDISDSMDNGMDQNMEFTPAAGVSPDGKNPNSVRRNSNLGKAKRIVNRIKTKKRQSNPVSDETAHQSNIGGHGSTWLFR